MSDHLEDNQCYRCGTIVKVPFGYDFEKGVDICYDCMSKEREMKKLTGIFDDDSDQNPEKSFEWKPILITVGVISVLICLFQYFFSASINSKPSSPPIHKTNVASPALLKESADFTLVSPWARLPGSEWLFIATIKDKKTEKEFVVIEGREASSLVVIPR